jgi:hypothetical protein
MNNQTLINKTRTKKFILMVANDAHQTNGPPDEYTDASGRAWDMSRANKLMAGKKFTQISQDLLDELDRSVRKLVDDRIREHQQAGKTVR